MAEGQFLLPIAVSYPQWADYCVIWDESLFAWMRKICKPFSRPTFSSYAVATSRSMTWHEKKLSGDMVYQHALKPETTYSTNGDTEATRYPARLRTAKPRAMSSVPSLGSQLAQRR
jgi:hypothetical protein